ncbi:MAG: YqaJ viral recombinase family protein [Clostridia bacterium]|nr:YqaJ viral recombinase family protein [Clostridia bacterium]
MEKISKISTLGMSREEWLEERRKSIGGSDAGAVLGLNRYTSPYALWAEKTGRIVPEDISDKEAVRLGNDLEDYVAARFTEATGKKVRKSNAIIYNSDYPYAHANIDRQIVGEAAGLECKTTSSWEVLDQCRNGRYPEAWYAQVMHYLMVTGAEAWYLGVLVLGRGFWYFEIRRDEDEIAALAKAEAEFWEHVKSGIPPDIDGSESTAEAISTIYRDSEASQGVDLMPMSSALAGYGHLKEALGRLEEQLAAYENQIKEYMGTAETGTYGDYTVSWKSQQRQTFDRKKWEADHGPIPPQYFKTGTSRPFRITNRG